MLPQDMQKCQVYAGRKISFEPEEVTQIKSFDGSGLQVYMSFIHNLIIILHLLFTAVCQQ